MHRSSRWALGALGLALAIGLWEAVARSGIVNAVLLPPPSLIAPTLAGLVISGSFLAPLAHTLVLLLAGYSIACVLGITLGVAMGWNRDVYNLLEPLIELLRPIPKPALVPPLFLFLGIGPTTMVTIVALAAFFPIVINTVQGVRGIDPVLIDTARTFRCSPARTIFRVVLPAALPMILTGMRVSLGLGLVLVILAEMLAGEGGLGYLVQDMQRSFRVREMYAWIVILAATGLGLNAIFEAVEARAVPWRSR
jgi:ABC-type nitrate/sulfonate/bicarbonate transport system permease component